MNKAIEDRFVEFEGEEYLVLYFDSGVFQLFGPLPEEEGENALAMVYQDKGPYEECKKRAIAHLSRITRNPTEMGYKPR